MTIATSGAAGAGAQAGSVPAEPQPRAVREHPEVPSDQEVRAAPTPRERRQDVLLAGALFVAALISGTLSSVSFFYGDQTADLIWVIPLAIATTWPLALRRRYPISVAVVVSAAYFVGVSMYVPEAFVGTVAMFIGIYTVGAWVDDRRRAFWARIVLIVAMLLWLLIATFIAVTEAPSEDPELYAGTFSPVVAYMLLQWLINVAYFGGAYYMGDHAYRAALDRQALQAMADQLAEERELSATQAVALDRVRIARELHDIVGHHVSAMGVQAGAARTVLRHDPDAAAGVLKEVESSARDAIDELHQLLDTLRDAGEEQDAPSALRLSSLDALVRQVTAVGTPTTLTVLGDRVELSPLIEVNLYRIAQEALTNARRHGGPDVTADVRLRYLPDAVELEVTNTGRVRAGARPGVGQLGMRERATAIGGTLHFGRRETAGEGSVERSGYLVRIRVPLEQSA